MMKLENIRTAITLFLVGIGTALYSQTILLESDSSSSQHTTPSRQKVSIGQILFSGVPIHKLDRHEMWYIPSVFELFQFNTIEGFVINPSVSFTKYLNERKFLNLSPNLRYGVGNQRPQAQLTALYFYNAQKLASIKLTGGRYVKQLNDRSSLDGFSNTYNTLLSEQNFLKIYQTTFLKSTHTFSPAKDFLLTKTLHWESRESLRNLQRFNEDNSDFTSNNPENIELVSTAFDSHQAFLWHGQLRWQLDQRYKRYRGKFVSQSNHPAVSLSFISAFSNVWGSDISFQKSSLSLSDRYQIGSIGTGQLLIEGGNFLSKDSISFIDFNHFNGNQSVYNSFAINGFQLLNYYQYSNSGFYLEGHLQHKIKEFSIGKRPLTIRPVLSAHYLSTDFVNYVELGVGIEKILKNWRVDFYSSILNGSYESSGIRFGYLIESLQ